MSSVILEETCFLVAHDHWASWSSLCLGHAVRGRHGCTVVHDWKWTERTWHGTLAIRFELCPQPADSRPFSGPLAQGPDTSDTDKIPKIILKSHMSKVVLTKWDRLHLVSIYTLPAISAIMWASGQKQPGPLPFKKKRVGLWTWKKESPPSLEASPLLDRKISKTQQTSWANNLMKSNKYRTETNRCTVHVTCPHDHHKKSQRKLLEAVLRCRSVLADNLCSASPVGRTFICVSFRTEWALGLPGRLLTIW